MSLGLLSSARAVCTTATLYRSAAVLERLDLSHAKATRPASTHLTATVCDAVQVYFIVTAIPFALRMISMFSGALIPTAVAVFSPSCFSAIGQPYEFLYLVSATLLAEAFCYWFERANRRYYYKTLVTGQSDACPQSITLRFLDDEFERDYVTHRFTTTYAGSIKTFAVTMVMILINCTRSPELIFNACCSLSVSLLFLIFRVRVHGMSDQFRACQLFSWVVVCAPSISFSIRYLSQGLYAHSNVAATIGVKFVSFCIIVAIRLLVIVYARYIGLPNLQSHLLTLSYVIWITVSSPWPPSPVYLLQVAVAILGTLLAYALESYLRHSYMTLRSSADAITSTGGKSKDSGASNTSISVSHDADSSKERNHADLAIVACVGPLPILLVWAHWSQHVSLPRVVIMASPVCLLLACVYVRLSRRRMAEQQKPDLVFSWFTCTCVLLYCAVFWRLRQHMEANLSGGGLGKPLSCMDSTRTVASQHQRCRPISRAHNPRCASLLFHARPDRLHILPTRCRAAATRAGDRRFHGRDDDA